MVKTFTPAGIMKRVKLLEQVKEDILRTEKQSSTYTKIGNNGPVAPDYDYAETRSAVSAINNEILLMRYALNKSNAENSLGMFASKVMSAGRATMSPCEALIWLAQMNDELRVLKALAGRQPREEAPFSLQRNSAEVMYTIANYDVDRTKEDMQTLMEDIAAVQMALDDYNLNTQVEVDLPE